MTEKFINWCADNSPAAKLERTIAQGVFGAIIAAVPQMIGLLALPEWGTALIVATVMAILSPIMAAIGEKN